MTQCIIIQYFNGDETEDRPEEPIFTADSINQEPFLGPFTHSLALLSVLWWGPEKDILAGQNEWLLVSSSSNSRRTSPTKHSIYHLVISFCRAQWGSRPEPEPPWSWQWWCSTMIPRSCILFWEEPNRDCDQVQAHQDHSGFWTTWINLSASFWLWTAITPATLFIQAVLVACHCCPTDNTIITSPVQRLWGCHQRAEAFKNNNICVLYSIKHECLSLSVSWSWTTN